MSGTLAVTPTSIPAGQTSTLHYVGSGFQPLAQLVIGIENQTASQVAPVEADGTFDRTFDFTPTQQHGTVKAFAHAFADNYDVQPNVNIHIG